MPEYHEPEIRYIEFSAMNPAPYNPRKKLQPGDVEYENLKQSLNQFGYVEFIIWNEATRNVVGGHQKMQVLIDEGHTGADVVVVHIDNEKDEKRLNLALNKLSGEWDDEKLRDVLQELKNNPAGLDATGFSLEEADELLKTVSNTNFISDLLNDDFVSYVSNPAYFQVTFAFKTEYKDSVQEYIKTHGKDRLVELILKETQGDE